MGLIAAIWASALLANPTGAPLVSVASGDWSNIPLARSEGDLQVSNDVMARIATAAIAECKLGGESKRYLRLTIPFLIHFSPGGDVQQVVVKRFNCPTLEKGVGGAILKLAQKGEYKPTGENLEHWYRGEIDLESR